VADRSTALLMTAFYEQLLAGQPAPEALRRARVALRAEDGGRYRDPYYWGAFVYIGR
jgi:CHAT domain-containing protein